SDPNGYSASSARWLRDDAPTQDGSSAAAHSGHCGDILRPKRRRRESEGSRLRRLRHQAFQSPSVIASSPKVLAMNERDDNRRRTILVVDDNEINRDILVTRL